MKLNFRKRPAVSHTISAVSLPAVVLLHGLFGSMDNLGVLARDLQRDHDILQLDMRNHGLSPRSETMSYPAMAQDIADTLDACNLQTVILIGHSMGGKAAMAFSTLVPERLAALIVLDIAPVDYRSHHHEAVFRAVTAVTEAGVSSRSQAAQIMEQYLKEPSVILFLLKSFHAGNWRFNVPVLRAQYSHVVGWNPLPASLHAALFIRGADSSYLKEAYQPALKTQFPVAQLCTVPDAGHWVHAQQPQAVLAHIRRFLTEQQV